MATVASNEFDLLNADTYTSVGTLEAGSTRDLTFSLRADAGNGVYYPEVQIDLGDAGSIRYAVPIRIDNSGIQASIEDAPGSYMKGQQNEVTVAVFNPRQNTVNGVTVTAAGTNLTVSDTAGFIGALAADQSRNVSFQVTPQDSTTLTLAVSYRNGLTDHSTVLTVPMTVGDRSTAADPVVNGIEVTNSGGTYTLSGDVTNAGINDARGVVVTVGSPATPDGPEPQLRGRVPRGRRLRLVRADLHRVRRQDRAAPRPGQGRRRERVREDGRGHPSGGGAGAANASAGSASGVSSSGGFQGGAACGRPRRWQHLRALRRGPSGQHDRVRSSLPILPIAGVVVVLVVLGVAWRKG